MDLGTFDPAADREAARELRRRILEALRDCGVQREGDGELLTWELVTNAGRHAETPCTIAIDCATDVVHVEVRDGARAGVETRAPDPNRIGGHGLELVAALSESWGVRPLPEGKAVWFELRRTTG